jgi:hypothetical protein
MHIFIRDFGQHSMEFVDVINDDMSRRFVLRPFQNTYVSDVAKADGKLFCLASSLHNRVQRTDSTQLAVFDSTTGEEIRRTLLPFQANTVTYLPQNGMLAVQQSNRFISFLNAKTLEVLWQSSPLFAPQLKKKWLFGWGAIAQQYHEVPLDTFPYPPGCVYVGSRLFEDGDGRILGLSSSEWGDRLKDEILGYSVGVISFDTDAQKPSYHPIEFSPWGAQDVMAPSPDGRKAVRESPQYELGPAFDVGHDPTQTVWLIKHQSLDVWSLSDQKPLSRLFVSDIPVSKYIGLEGLETEKRLRDLSSWSRRTKDRFKMPFRMPPGTEKLTAGYYALRDLRDLQEHNRIEVFWEEDSSAIWVVSRYSLRRITIEGERGPLLIFDRFLNDEHREMLDKRLAGTDIGVGEVYPAVKMPVIKAIRTNAKDVEINFYGEVISFPKENATSDAPMTLLTDDMISIASIPNIKAKDVADKIPGLVKVKSWGQDDVAASLQDLADTLRNDISSLTANGMSLVFQLRSSFLSEKEFIEKLSTKDIDVTQDVKGVIDGWNAALRQHSLLFPGDEEGAGPLSYFLEYLAERDRDCSEQLRNYCLLRDGEHENYSRDSVLRTYLDRTGFSRPELWRLGILHALLFGRDGLSVVSEGQQISNWVHTGLLDKARETLPPQDFAQYVLQELEAFELQPDKFAAFGTHAEAAANAKQDLLDQLKNTAWDKGCRATLVGRDILP